MEYLAAEDALIPVFHYVETRVVVNREPVDGEDAGIITAYKKTGGPFGAGEPPESGQMA